MATAVPLPAHEARLRAELAALVEYEELELPLLPGAASQVLERCSSNSCDARELSDTIQNDVALAGHVLRVASSALWAPSEPIVSLVQAISRLGFDTVRDIAVGVASRARVFTVPCFERLTAQIWRHSVLTASWAREIARERRRGVEGAFLAGLLHDIGRPVVLQVAVDLAGAQERKLGEHEAIALTDEFHAGVGALLLARWKLPASFAVVARAHHSPHTVKDHAEIVACVALADALAHLEDDDVDEKQRIASLPILATLGLYADELEGLIARTRTVIDLAGTFA